MNKNKFKKIAAFACTAMLTGVLAFSLTACGGDDNNNGDNGDNTNTTQSALQLDKSTATVKVGATVNVTVTSSNGSITWKSSDESVATVSASGPNNKICTVSGVKAGTVTITAKDGDNEATCSVTVQPAEQQGGDETTETVSIKLGETEVGTDAYNLYGAGDKLTFSAVASKGSAITWETGDAAIATVADGVVTAVAAGETTITAKVSNDIKATVSVKVLAATDITYAEGVDAFSSGWRYFNGGTSEKTISTHESYGDSGAKIKYTWNWVQGDEWWNVQLFYRNEGLGLIGKDHKVTLNVVASHAGDVTINGVQKTLEVGPNAITVEHYNGITLAVAFGVDGKSSFAGTDVEFLIKDLVFETNVEKELKAPEFSYNDETNVITITDNEANADIAAKDKAYRLVFLNSDNQVVTMVPVENGEEVNLSDVNSGDYTVRLQAYSNSDKIVDSGWSTSTATIHVDNEFVKLDWHGEQDASFTTGWAYYSQCNTTRYQMAKDSNTSAGTIYYAWKNKGGNPWDAQLFYKDSAITPGDYTVTLTISTTKDTDGATVKVALAPQTAVSPVEQDGKYVYTSSYDITATGSNTLISIMFGADGGSMIDGGDDGIEFVVEYTITPKTAA